jgi:hypothetical protein
MMLDDPDERFDHNPPADQRDRREGKRHSIVLLVGKICRSDHESVCLVHNISNSGLMARFTKPPTVGERLRIEVRGLPLAPGTVRWVTGLKAGFKFDDLQDVNAVFRPQQADGKIARAPRFAVEALARLRFEAEPFTAELTDISAGGAKLKSDTPVTAGLTGEIMLPDTGTSVYGTICWTRKEQFGVKFVAPLTLATLSQILRC